MATHRNGESTSCLLWLKSWLYSLPTSLKPVQGGDLNRLPQAYTLCMVYHTAVILLARPYIQSLRTSNSLEPPDPLVAKAFTIIIEAARSISSLNEQYHRTFDNFQRSPITTTHTNLSAALALLNPRCQSQCKPRLSQADEANIKSCIQTLDELSTAWMPPGKYHCSILRMMQDKPANRQSEGTTSDLTAGQEGNSPSVDAKQPVERMGCNQRMLSGPRQLMM